MTTTIIIVAGVLVVILFFSIVVKVTFSLLFKSLLPRVLARYPEKDIVKMDLTAMSFGQESKGKFQGRGNGALVLTAKEVVFIRAVMETVLVIPLTRVTNLSFVHSHLGKATPFRLLKIEFDGDAGQDSIALIVKNPTEFRDEIEKARAAA